MNDRKKDILIFVLLLLFSSSISIWSLITESFATFVIMGLFAIRMIYDIIKTIFNKNDNTY
ncbi:hypothetical protein AB4Y49_10395 [Staphylococcus pseudintermedius]|uniref:hypothetical protein n=1 Tax=Staphylococcus pseudintermedius TaxID=283734 RepID=UPI0007AECF03|nr:hypothetical protein [Staphylococcus pseudintermedius]EGQ0360747.1 hypothetical protein [Staphylococcus pseudintermedius]EGQ0398162.1 hypothetical protein [Staphylococcus pseudintermedius]EGQ1649451.1 hypothetical protein [Staphylococcus pseudintermedius]EGQ1651798.1 hypothetical protein [Staphylococcus pseudintermedius]EGQ1658625.1 hypothetical protein [Staphylococcus pseudintermedius]